MMKPNVSTQRRSDEEFCKDAVVQFLRDRGHTATAVETAPPQPDYALTVDGIEHAFEVTTIMDALEIGPGNAMPRATVEAGLESMVREAEAIAKARGALSGGFHVDFSAHVVPDLRVHRRPIVEAIMRYVETVGSGEAQGETVYSVDDDDFKVRVVRFSWSGAKLNWGGIELDYEEYIIKKARELVYERLRVKAECLENERRPHVIGLLARYPAAWKQLYEKAFADGLEPHGFDGIFLVYGDRGVTNLRWVPPNDPSRRRAAGAVA